MSMLEKMPKNYISIRDLLDDYQKKESAQAKNIVYLLERTKHFLIETAPEYQEERAANMTNEVMQEILNDAAKGFMVFAEASHEELQNASGVLAFCRLTILERLELLQRNKDNLFTYYATQDNALKTALMTNNQF